ncbi:hypothetical protein Tco_0680137 [Tanacetum coccineum]|uniref:Uncharacterized protein n=1 Tax=Tanacetum coccineum TaxID=301880 RepID=A0ABQ4XKT9_9ASTR
MAAVRDRKWKRKGFFSTLTSKQMIGFSNQLHKQINNNPYTSFGFVMSLNDYRGLDVPTAKLFLIPTGKLMVHRRPWVLNNEDVYGSFWRWQQSGRSEGNRVSSQTLTSKHMDWFTAALEDKGAQDLMNKSSRRLMTPNQVHKQISNNPFTSFGYVISFNDYRGLDVPTAKLFLIPTGKLMVPVGSSWFLLVVLAGRLCGSYWSAYEDLIYATEFKIQEMSVEAEYRGDANVVAETTWLRNVLREWHTPLQD